MGLSCKIRINEKPEHDKSVRVEVTPPLSAVAGVEFVDGVVSYSGIEAHYDKLRSTGSFSETEIRSVQVKKTVEDSGRLGGPLQRRVFLTISTTNKGPNADELVRRSAALISEELKAAAER
jgi:hypothetical protein